jgi:regulatory protein
MKVQALRVGKRKTDKVSVILDDDSVVQLDPEIVVKFQLRTGMELDEGTLATLRAEHEKLTARRRLVRYLSCRKKSMHEARTYLARLGFPDFAVEAALSAALELGLLDDTSFTEAFVRTQKRVAKKGPRALTHELVGRGVNRAEVEKALEKNYSLEEQRALARAVAAKRLPTLQRSEEPHKTRQRLFRYLMNRGFDPEVCSEIVEELLGNLEENI